MVKISEIKRVAEYCEQYLNLNSARLGEEYYYQSLPLCVIDAVFSIQANYESQTKQVVIRYCDYFRLRRIRTNRGSIPARETQESLETFLENMHHLGIDKFTREIFDNRQLTSSRGGILKSEAVLRFSKTLRKHGVNYLQDVAQIVSDAGFEREIKSIPGQKSGITLSYFFMLSGSDDLIKPDTWIMRFLKRVLKRDLATSEAQPCLLEVNTVLNPKYPHLTPRLLDNTIWKYERAKKD